MKTFSLKIISQERELLDKPVQSLSVPGEDGELTILANHVALLSRLQMGELKYVANGVETSMVISRGFLSCSHENEVLVIADTAIEARELSVKKAQEAIEAAKKRIQSSNKLEEYIQAEASLRLAMIELKVAKRSL